MLKLIKTEEAKRLLRYSDKPITAISSYLGFSSPSHFSRVFKTRVCITPGEPQEMADAIIRLHASTVPLSELGARARSYACEHASREQATRAYFDWIKG